MADQNEGEQTASPPAAGTLIRAQNGDIVRFDPSGLTMVLSDKVIADIAGRLPPQARPWIDPGVLGNIDAWDLRADGEWYVFSANLRGRQGPRLFRRLMTPDDAEQEPKVIADGAGPLCGLFSLGGARQAMGLDAELAFPWHVLAPADDIGAVGHAGAPADICTALEPLRELTRDAALADCLVARQFDAHEALSLFVTRAETDNSPSIRALARGAAYDNLMVAVGALQAAAERLGRPAVLAALTLAYTLEDVDSDGPAYRDGVLDLLSMLTRDIAARGLRMPPVLAQFDCGTHTVNDHPVLRAQWDLAWQGGQYGLCYTAPGYMFRQDRYARPDLAALRQMAEMDAAALAVLHQGAEWTCPIFLLAEREPDPAQIRVRARAMGDLVIDDTDPFGAGPSRGFSLAGATNAPVLTDIAVAGDDRQDLILTFDTPPEGTALELRYAFGMAPERAGMDYPQACGAIRDGWQAESVTGPQLHRWALPAAIPVW